MAGISREYVGRTMNRKQLEYMLRICLRRARESTPCVYELDRKRLIEAELRALVDDDERIGRCRLDGRDVAEKM